MKIAIPLAEGKLITDYFADQLQVGANVCDH